MAKAENDSPEDQARGVLGDAEVTARGKIDDAASAARKVLGDAADAASINLLASAGGLTAALERLNITLSDLKTDVRRRTIFAITIIAFDLLLTIGLGVGLRTAISANNQANTSLVAQVAACQSNNDARKGTRDFWDNTVIPAIKPANPTPTQSAAYTAFQAKVDSTYAPRDCSAIR